MKRAGCIGNGAARAVFWGLRRADSLSRITLLPLFFAIQFLLGPPSNAAGTPGGLFAPILALGACLGLGFGLLCPQVEADSRATPITFAIADDGLFDRNGSTSSDRNDPDLRDDRCF